MRSSRPRLRTGLAVAATLSMVTGALALGVQAAGADSGPAGRATLHGTKPLWATQKADRGSTPASNKISVRVYLAGRDAAGLAAYAKDVSDPSSSSYGEYLSAKQTQARFGATKQQVSDVTAWLTSTGLKVTGTNAHYLTVSGGARAVEKAFSTKLHNYAKGGKTYHAPDATASVPESLHGAVLTVVGLDNAPRASKAADELPPPDPAFLNAGPFSSYYGSTTDKKLPNAYGSKAPYTIQGYTGKQLRAAYGAKSFTGKGVTVAITDAYASPTIAQDATTYAKRNGDKKYKAGQFSQVLPSNFTIDPVNCPDPAGWYGEETLDVESVHAVAPDANITYVGASSCLDDDLLDSLSKVVDTHLADIVTNSWGDVEAAQTPASQAAYDQVFQMGAVEGIGFYFSTGDDGDFKAATGTKQVDMPANSAWVTAVGGTSLAVGKNDKYQWETGWGTDQASLTANKKNWDSLPGAFTSGAGGGTSATVPQPFYQKGVVPDSLATANGATPMRTMPDISAVADPNTGFLIGQTQTQADGSVAYSQYRLGGTSLASPVIAGIQALAQEAQHGVPIGFANPGIYQRYGTPDFHDVTDHPLGAGQNIAVVRNDFVNTQNDADGITTTLRTLGHDSSLSSVVGYDDVTGVGSPAANYVSSYRTR
jgi:subtilase family serine protease